MEVERKGRGKQQHNHCTCRLPTHAEKSKPVPRGGRVIERIKSSNRNLQIAAHAREPKIKPPESRNAWED